MTIYTCDNTLFEAMKHSPELGKCTVTNAFSGFADVCAVTGNITAPLACSTLLVDSSALPAFDTAPSFRSVVSCGMSEKDSVTFSAIDRETAVMCIQRNIKIGNTLLECGEFPVKYDENLPIWQNLALSLCRKIQEL